MIRFNHKKHPGGSLVDVLGQVDETYGQIPRQVKLQIEDLCRVMPQAGSRRSRRSGQGFEPFGIRPFIQGLDRVRSISERHSVRSEDHPMVIDREQEIKQPFALWRDPRMGYRSRDTLLTDKLASEISMLAWAKKLAGHDDAVSVVAGSMLHRFGNNMNATATRLYDVSILAEPTPDPMKIKRGSHVTLWGKFYDKEETLRILDSFSGRRLQGHLIRMLDPREIDFDFHDNTELVGLHGEKSSTGQTSKAFSDAASMRRKWKEVFLENNLWLAQACQDHGFELLIQRTDEPLQNSLIKMLHDEPEDVKARLLAPPPEHRNG